jgi:ribonuclease D
VTRADLINVKGLSLKQKDHLGRSIIKKVREGLSLPDDALPSYPKKVWQRLRSRERARVKELKAWRDRLGGEWGVDPAVVCTNAQIEAIAIANPGGPEEMEGIKGVRKWQIRLFGPDICNLLQQTG